MNDSQRVSILSEALPYIQSFSGRKIVIKYGGSVMEDDHLKNAFFRVLKEVVVNGQPDPQNNEKPLSNFLTVLISTGKNFHFIDLQRKREHFKIYYSQLTRLEIR